MTDKPEPKQDKHWLRPLKGRVPESRHVLLWCETEKIPAKRDTGAMGVRLKRITPSCFEVCKEGVAYWRATGDSQTGPHADVILDAMEPYKRYTVWLARGWQDMVLCGLTTAIEQGVYVWNWMSLDGANLSARGLWRGRRMDLCSLANWTGSSWDAWAQKIWDDDQNYIVQRWRSGQSEYLIGAGAQEILAMASVHSILTLCFCARLGDVRGSAGAQGRQWWRAWGGPIVTAQGRIASREKKKRSADIQYYVAPLPDRPDRAATAERHCCYHMGREQYRRGRIDGPVYVMDVKAAYLSSLCSMPIPVKFSGPLKAKRIADVAETLKGHVGLALCYVQPEYGPLPYRRDYRQGRAKGQFWTWLAGQELLRAVTTGEVKEIYGGWKWTATSLSSEAATAVCDLASQFRQCGLASCVPAWRSLYSACVGSFAQWDRKWVDDSRVSQFGPWSTWTHYNPRTGELTQFRAIAGRVQYKTQSGEHVKSVPLLYACVLANLRERLWQYAAAAGERHVFATTADALWLDQRGFDRLQHAQETGAVSGLTLAPSAIFDRCWFDGKGAAVVEKDGVHAPLMAGIPHHVSIGDDGAAKWWAADPWSGTEEGPTPGKCTLRQRAFYERGVVNEYDYPAVGSNPYRNIHDTGLVEELLTPLLAPTERIDRGRSKDAGAM